MELLKGNWERLISGWAVLGLTTMSLSAQLVYTCKYKSEADIVIYYTKYKSEAGWVRN